MKSLITKFTVILLFSSLLLNASVTYDLHFSPSDLSFDRQGDYDIVSVKGTSFMDDVGKPMLPVKYLQLILPQGTKAQSAEVEIHSNYQIPGSYNIFPAQSEVPIGEDTTFIPPDSSVYNSDNPYPSKKVRILKTGNFAGNSIATIAFYPLQYKPASGELTFYTDVTITLSVRASGDIGSRPIQRTPNSYRIYKNMLYSIVDNDWNIPGYCWEPSIVENTYTAEPPGIGAMFPYVIITADSLKDAFSPFVKWLTKKGIEAHTISVSTIVSEYPGGDPVSGIVDDAGSIRAFLKDGYEGGLLQWALLGGDEDIVPVRYGYNKISDNWPSFDFLIPTDLYYADIHGNWNSDMDTLFGEFFNNAPSAFTVFGKCNFPLTRGWDMKVKNNYAYVAGGKNGLYIIDISDSTSPYVISSLPLKDSANAQAISIEGDYLYVAANEYGLHIVDISNPNYPEEISANLIDGVSRDIDVLNDFTYIANYDRGLTTVDVSNPEEPIVIGNFDTPGYALGIRVKDTLAFIADSSGGIRVFNVSDPESAFEIGFNDSIHYVMDIDVQGDFAYIADGALKEGDSTAFQAVDISDPTHPVLRGKTSFAFGQSPRGIRIEAKDNFLYTIVSVPSLSAQYLHIYKIVTPDSLLTSKYYFRQYHFVEGLGVRNPYVYIADSDSFKILLPFIGDSVDFYPEIFVGRIPANTHSEIENWVDKVLCYERDPGNGDYSYLTKSFCFDSREFPYSDSIISAMPSYFDHLIMNEDDNPTGKAIIDTMNNKFGFYQISSHGDADRFIVWKGGGTNRNFVFSSDSGDIYWTGCNQEIGNSFDSLRNKDFYSVLYSIACEVCAYDYEDIGYFNQNCLGPCMATAFLTFPEGGGPSFLGNTRAGIPVTWPIFGGSCRLHYGFLKYLFNENSEKSEGVVEAISKVLYGGDYLSYSHNLFGCPEMPIWTDIPQYFVVSFPPFVKSQDSLSIEFTVEVTDTLGIPVDSAYICLWKGEEVYKTGFTSVGITTFQISPQTEGWMSVTLTKPNYIPFEDSSYVLEELVTCVNTSEATYPNAQKKIRYPDKSDDDIGLIFSSDEYSISATGSPDNGNSWNNPSFVGQGGGHSLTIRLFKEYDFYHWNGVYLDSSGVVSAAGTTSVGNDIVVPQEWQHQYLWQPPNPSIQLISSASDRGDNLHSCILYGEWGGNDEAIRYREFEWQEFPDNSWRLVTDEIVTSSSNITHHSHPAIAADLRGIPHLVWEWNGEVLYSTKYQDRWCEPVKLSRIEHFSKEPFIEARGDYVRAVWVQEDEKTENGDICMRLKYIDDPPDDWEEIEYIRKGEADSRYPQVAGGENYSWCEHYDENWDVFIYTGDTVQNLSNSFFNDKYPQIDYNPHGYLYCGWTKIGEQGSAVVEKTLSTGKTSYYTIEGGDSISSKRLIHRDGLTSLSGYSFDYAQDSLVYHCPFLDSTRLFNIRIIGYSGGLTSWNDSLSHLTVLIDGQEIQGRIHTSSLPTIDCEIPREMYRDDEEVIITLKPEENEYALLSRLWLFDSEIPSLHRKDYDREVVNKGVPYYLTVHPNPFINNWINIEFGLPTKKRVDISIYDCTGRQVAKLLSEKMGTGIHRISWRGYDKNRRELPSGVYFCNLKTADIRMVKKIILIR